MASEDAQQQPCRSPGIAEIEDLFRLGEPARAHAVDPPHARGVADERDTERAQRAGGSEHVLAFEQPLDPALADCERGEHERSMRDRLVAGDAGAAL